MKSLFFLCLVAVVWLCLIVLMSPVQLPLTLAGMLPSNRIKACRYAFWIWQDQGVNVIVSMLMLRPSNPDVTVSSKVGWLVEQGSSTAKGMAYIIDGLFYMAIGQENHCKESIEHDEVHYRI